MNEKIGAKIRSLRETKRLTQEQVADKMNCSRQKYARIEKGLIDISYSNIVLIAEMFDVNTKLITSAVEEDNGNQPLYRTVDHTAENEKFDFINKMIDTFYAHRKIYNSVRQDDECE